MFKNRLQLFYSKLLEGKDTVIKITDAEEVHLPYGKINQKRSPLLKKN